MIKFMSAAACFTGVIFCQAVVIILLTNEVIVLV